MKSVVLSSLFVKIYLIFLFIALIILFTISPAFSYTASNENIKLDTQVLGKKDPIKLETKKPPKNIVTSPKNSAFSFSVSDNSVIFGKVVPGEPLQRTITLMVKSRSNSGYSVLVSENSALTNAKTKTVVPDTTCDDGICSDLLAATWNSPLTYGFGMRCDNIKAKTCISGFGDDYYKQFPNLKSGKKMQKIMGSNPQSEAASAQITYKLNLAPAQAQGSYQNITTYILAPNF